MLGYTQPNQRQSRLPRQSLVSDAHGDVGLSMAEPTAVAHHMASMDSRSFTQELLRRYLPVSPATVLNVGGAT
jgi:hypothetical protein